MVSVLRKLSPLSNWQEHPTQGLVRLSPNKCQGENETKTNKTFGPKKEQQKLDNLIRYSHPYLPGLHTSIHIEDFLWTGEGEVSKRRVFLTNWILPLCVPDIMHVSEKTKIQYLCQKCTNYYIRNYEQPDFFIFGVRCHKVIKFLFLGLKEHLSCFLV